MKARGWRVFATARKPEDIARLRDEGLESLYLDYAEPRSIEDATKHVLDATGGTLDGALQQRRIRPARCGRGPQASGSARPIRGECVRLAPSYFVADPDDAGAKGGTHRVLLLGARPRRRALSRCLLRLEIRRRGFRRRAPDRARAFRHQDRAHRAGPDRDPFLEHALGAYRRNIDLEGSPTATSTAPALRGWRRAAIRPSSSGPRRSPPSWLSRWKAATQNPAITSPLQLMRPHVLRPILPTRALDAWPRATRVSAARRHRRGANGTH